MILMNKLFKLKIFTNYVTTVNGNQKHQPIDGWIQNHTENLSKK